jgi:hypothetical protein
MVTKNFSKNFLLPNSKNIWNKTYSKIYPKKYFRSFFSLVFLVLGTRCQKVTDKSQGPNEKA